MKNFMFTMQKLMLSLVMFVGLSTAISNVNSACYAWLYQPTPPKGLQRYQKLNDE